jgi:hypothetical protein
MPTLSDWIQIAVGFFGAVSAVASAIAVRQAYRSSREARTERDVDRESRRNVLLRRVVPALYQALSDLEHKTEMLNRFVQPGHVFTGGNAFNFSVIYSRRLYELEPELHILSGDDAARIANAIERVRQYEVAVEQLQGPEAQRVLSRIACLALAPVLASAKIALQEAMRPFEPRNNVAVTVE